MSDDKYCALCEDHHPDAPCVVSCSRCADLSSRIAALTAERDQYKMAAEMNAETVKALQQEKDDRQARIDWARNATWSG